MKTDTRIASTGYIPVISNVEKANALTARLRLAMPYQEAKALTKKMLKQYGGVTPEFVRDLDFIVRQKELNK